MATIALDALARSIRAQVARSEQPKYECLVNAFEQGVRSGRFKPGQRVPTEVELAERLPLSLGTVQKAMQSLAASGVLVRRRKAGTFIAERRSQVDEVHVYRFHDPVTGALQMPFVHTLKVALDDLPGPWQQHLGAARTVRVDRLVWVDDDPPAFNSIHLSIAHGSFLMDMPVEALHGSSCHRLLVERFNLPSVRVEHAVSCAPLTADACVHLSLAAGTVGLIWDVCDFTFDQRPFFFQRFQLPPGHRPMRLSESVHPRH